MQVINSHTRFPGQSVKPLIHLLASRYRCILDDRSRQSAIMWSLTLILASLLLRQVSATERNISISDQSPTVFYSPSKSGLPSETWNVTYSQSNSSAWIPGAVGNGDSTHYTTFIGASISFGFRGTGIYISGSAGTSGDVRISIGDQEANYGDGGEGFVGWKSGLEDKWWAVKVNVTGNGGVNITGFMFTINIGADR